MPSRTAADRRVVSTALTIVMVAGVLVLAACGLPRPVADRADPRDYAALDVCGVVPVDQLRATHPDVDVEVRYFADTTTGCSVTVGTTGLMVGAVPAALPSAITEWGGEGVTRDSVDGGTVIDVERERDDGLNCVSYAMADNDLWLYVGVEDATPDGCAVVRTVARAAVAGLRDGGPRVAWPEGSLYRKDICAATERSGIARSLGIDVAPAAGPAHLSCTYDIASTDATRGWTVRPWVSR